MKICTFESCERKHHAKGFCKLHYKQVIVSEIMKERKCSIEGCEKRVRQGYMCSMHESRLQRHGTVDVERTRTNRLQPILDELDLSKDKMNFVIDNYTIWTAISKAIHGKVCQRCGWDKGTCDVHHKLPRSEGGLNTLNNAEVICPNCHRLEHQYTFNYYSDEMVLHIKNIIEMGK